MTTHPLISIVLPTYNGSRYLEQAIQSCLDQTYQHWELIIVDDASTDETPAIIARFVDADCRIHCIRHASNRKLPAALNSGFSQAQGDLLTWTSDDNCYRPAALATMLTFLESHREINFVYCDYTIIDAAGRPQNSMVVPPPDRLAITNCIGCCFLYRRQVADRIGQYAEDLTLAEDYDFWLRVSLSFRLVPLHRDLYLYRRHTGSLTGLQLDGVITATEQTLARWLPQLHWVSHGMRARGYIRLSGLASARKDWTTARHYLLQAMRHAPLLTLLLTAYRKLGYRQLKLS